MQVIKDSVWQKAQQEKYSDEIMLSNKEALAALDILEKFCQIKPFNLVVSDTKEDLMGKVLKIII